MVENRPNQIEYSWTNITAIALCIGVSAYVAVGIQRGWQLGAAMGFGAWVAAIGFGCLMRRAQRRARVGPHSRGSH
jgi:hypothetical protein